MVMLGGCDGREAWHSVQSIDVSGSLPRLAFNMRRASDGREVTASDYRGKIVLLYFGYTSCPDLCPTTLLNLSVLIGKLGDLADRARILFVTIDPDRDRLDVLRQYTGSFAPQIDGLRGTPDQIAALAKRYRVAYSVKPIAGTGDYEVTHGNGVYVFDADGEARLLFAGLESTTPNFDAMAADLRHLAAPSRRRGLIARLLRLS